MAAAQLIQSFLAVIVPLDHLEEAVLRLGNHSDIRVGVECWPGLQNGPYLALAEALSGESVEILGERGAAVIRWGWGVLQVVISDANPPRLLARYSVLHAPAICDTLS